MAHSGIKLDENAMADFQNMKTPKKGSGIPSKILYFKITSPPTKEEKEKIVCEKGRGYFGVEGDSASGCFGEFLKDLAEVYKEEPVYVIYDLPYPTKTGMTNNKIILISWSPDNAPVKKKMLFASTKDYLKRSLEGVAKEFQASDLDDLVYEKLCSALL